MPGKLVFREPDSFGWGLEVISYMITELSDTGEQGYTRGILVTMQLGVYLN